MGRLMGWMKYGEVDGMNAGWDECIGWKFVNKTICSEEFKN